MASHSTWVCILHLMLQAYLVTAVTVPEKAIIFTSTNNTYVMGIKGGVATKFPVFDNVSMIYQGIAYNWRSSKFYLTETGTTSQSDFKHILVITLNGATRLWRKRIASHSFPRAVAADFISNVIYFTDSAEGEVVVVSQDADQHHTHTLMTSLPGVHSLALDPVAGMLFVSISRSSQSQNGHILRAHMDGSHREILPISFLRSPSALAIDTQARLLYFVDDLRNTISSTNYDGSAYQGFIGLSTKPLALAIDETYLYFAYEHSRHIDRYPKGGGSASPIRASNLPSMLRISDMVAITPLWKDSRTNHCSRDNGACQHICLPTPTGRKCVCDSKFTLAANGQSCRLADLEKVLLVTDKQRSGIFVIDTQSTAYLRNPLFNLNKPTGIAWDGTSKTFIWASEQYKRVGRSCLYPHRCINTVAIWKGENLRLQGLAVDPFNKQVYIADNVGNTIFRIPYDSAASGAASRVRIVRLGIGSPRGLALELTHRLVFWTEVLPIGKVRKASMDDGSGITTIIDSDIDSPNDVAVDLAGRFVYWCDGGRHTIERSTWAGGARTVLYRGTLVLLSLTLDDHFIYFTALNSRSVHRIDRLTGDNLRVIGPAIFREPYDIVFVDVARAPVRPVTVPPVGTTEQMVVDEGSLVPDIRVVLPAVLSVLFIFMAAITATACFVTRRTPGRPQTPAPPMDAQPAAPPGGTASTATPQQKECVEEEDGRYEVVFGDNPSFDAPVEEPWYEQLTK